MTIQQLRSPIKSARSGMSQSLFDLTEPRIGDGTLLAGGAYHGDIVCRCIALPWFAPGSEGAR
jgi:hypothetical protein